MLRLDDHYERRLKIDRYYRHLCSSIPDNVYARHVCSVRSLHPPGRKVWRAAATAENCKRKGKLNKTSKILSQRFNNHIQLQINRTLKIKSSKIKYVQIEIFLFESLEKYHMLPLHYLLDEWHFTIRLRHNSVPYLLKLLCVIKIYEKFMQPSYECRRNIQFTSSNNISTKAQCYNSMWHGNVYLITTYSNTAKIITFIVVSSFHGIFCTL